MRVRKLKLEWEGSSINLDFRGSSGYIEDVIGISGGNLSGKTLVQHLIVEMWLSGVGGRFSDGKFVLEDLRVNGDVEFDNGGEVTVGVIREGRIVQKPVMERVVSGGSGDGIILSYFAKIRMNEAIFGSRKLCTESERLLVPIIHDLKDGGVRNSVILIDDIDLGLDESGTRDFLGWVMRRSLERNNQLIVTSRCGGVYGGIGAERVRKLSGGGSYVDGVIWKMR